MMRSLLDVCIFLLRMSLESRQIVVNEAPLYVERQVEPRRAGTAALRQVIRFSEREGNLLRLDNHLPILRHIIQSRDDVELLSAQRAKRQTARPHRQRGFHLPREHEQRNRILISARNAVQGIDRTRPARHAERRHAPMDTRIGFRRHCRRLFMMAVYRRNLLVVPERIVEVHGAAANDGEYVRDAFFDKKIRDIV